MVINKVLLMQFYLCNTRPTLHHRKLRKLCITLFRTFLTSPAACWCCCSSNLYWKFSYKLPGTLKFTIIQTFDQNFVFFTEWSMLTGDVRRNFQNLRYFSVSGLKAW